MAMLKTIDDEHCVLWKTGDLMNDMKTKIETMIDGNSDRRICVRAYDIKQFYKMMK